MSKTSKHLPGITPRSVLASLFGILAVGLIVLVFEAVEGSCGPIGSHVVPLPAMLIMVPLVLGAGLYHWATRQRLLSRAELLCVLFSMFIATPLVSSGFWMMMIGAIGTLPKTADFENYDALPQTLWPHGQDLTRDALEAAGRASLKTQGQVVWETLALEGGPSAERPVLVNDHDGDLSWVRLRVPLARPTSPGATAPNLILEEPYLLTVLLRPDKLSPEASYTCRIYYDDQPDFATEAFSSRAGKEVNYLHPQGFLRKGMYGITVPKGVRDHIQIEFALAGRGRLELAECQFMSVGTLDAIYHGRRVIPESRFAQLGETARADLVVKPDNMVSLAGLQYLLSGYVPWRDWLRPFFTWTSYALLVLLATFCLAVIMRKQWIENERYPLPLTRIPLTLLGEHDLKQHALPPIWRNSMMWLGFGLALFWCLMKGWHLYNTQVPDMNINVELAPYFPDPSWGKMWKGEEVRNVTFKITTLFISVAIFMELNVLLSLVLGFFLFRCQHWFGEGSGLALKKDYPFPEQQQVGAYLAYAALILFFARKHLWRVLRASVKGDRAAWKDEALSYPTALTLLAFCFLGVAAWSSWAGIPVSGMMVFFGCLLLIGLVAAKLRAECGLTLAMFTPIVLTRLVPLAGGMILFGPAGVFFVCLANWIIFKFLFFLIPGMQVELLELGRRVRLPARHILGTALLGVLGGLLIGGWIYLSMGYALGGDNYRQRWPYMDKAFLVNDYNTELAKANATLPGAEAPREAAGLGAPAWGYIFAAGATTVITVLRQVFSGFWFHPIGFIVGSTPMLEFTWGSILAAWFIRAVTLKLGGAVAVRNKLLPFFVGVFLAGVTAYAIFGLLNVYLYFYHPALVRPTLLEF